MKSKIVVLLYVLILAACTKPSEMHQKYLSDGEIIYLQKPSQLQAKGGYYRAQIEFEYYYKPNISHTKIIIGDRETLVEMNDDVSDTTKVEVILPDLEERTYSMSICSIDEHGNQSLIQEKAVQVYGDFYISTLKNRKCDSWEYINNKLVVYWSSSMSSAHAVELKYVTEDGETHEVLVSSEENISEVETSKVTSLEYRTVYLPSPDAIDLFYAPYISM